MPTRTQTAPLNAVALSATVHCLTGCAIGEVLGMVIGTAAGFSNLATVALSIVLAFVFGYSLHEPAAAALGLGARDGRPARARVRHDLDRDHGDRRQRADAADPRRDGRRTSATCGSGAASRWRC